MGAGCRLWRLLPSWFRDWSEAGEVAVTGRWFQSLIVWGKKELNRTGCLVCSWCSRWAPLVLGSAWGQKLVRSISTNPLLIRYIIWSRLWSLVCLGSITVFFAGMNFVCLVSLELQHRDLCWYELCLPGLFGAPTPGSFLVRTVSAWSVWSSNTGAFVGKNFVCLVWLRLQHLGLGSYEVSCAWYIWGSGAAVLVCRNLCLVRVSDTSAQLWFKR